MRGRLRFGLSLNLPFVERRCAVPDPFCDRVPERFMDPSAQSIVGEGDGLAIRAFHPFQTSGWVPMIGVCFSIRLSLARKIAFGIVSEADRARPGAGFEQLPPWS